MDEDDQVNAVRQAANCQTAAVAAANGSPAADRRSQRLQELYVQAVAEPDALQASLGAAMTDLLEVTYRYGSGIKATMDSAAKDRELCKEMAPAIRSFSLLNRQIIQFCQLSAKLAAAEHLEGSDRTSRRQQWRRIEVLIPISPPKEGYAAVVARQRLAAAGLAVARP